MNQDKGLFRIFFSILILNLVGCTTPDNQDDINTGSSNKIAQSPCLKNEIEPFYVNGVWIKSDLLNDRI